MFLDSLVEFLGRGGKHSRRSVRLAGDGGEHVGEIVPWVYSVELGALDQGVQRGPPASEPAKRILAANGDTAQDSLSGIAVESQTGAVRNLRCTSSSSEIVSVQRNSGARDKRPISW